jgi:hypothetical protein
MAEAEVRPEEPSERHSLQQTHLILLFFSPLSLSSFSKIMASTYIPLDNKLWPIYNHNSTVTDTKKYVILVFLLVSLLAWTHRQGSTETREA